MIDILLFKGQTPSRPIEGVPSTWMWSSSESGYSNGKIFYEWFLKIFLAHCGSARPVVLLLDNHDSHVTAEVVQAALDNGVVLLGLPSHTTHLLQPLDVKVNIKL